MTIAVMGVMMMMGLQGCTKDGDFWNLGRRNPHDAGLNVNPDDDRLPLVRTLEVEPGDGVWRADLINEGRRKMETVGWVWTEDGSEPLYPDDAFLVSDDVELGLHSTPIPEGFCNSTVKFRAFAINRFGTAYGAVLPYAASAEEGSAEWSAASAAGTSTSTITATATLTLSECVAATDIGVCWSSLPDPTMANATLSLGSEPGPQEALLSGFAPGEAVHLRFYAVTGLGTTYSEGLLAETLPPGPPTVTTSEATAVLEQSALLQGALTDDGGSPITARGFYLSTTSNPGPGDEVLDATSTGDAWSASAENLIGNTTYYFRAFATNSAGTGLGNILSFTTAPAPTAPTVSTTSASSIGIDQATLNGNVTSNGGDPVSQRGFYLSTTSNPGPGDVTLTSGSGTGTFNALASSLTAETSYFFRAFATNAIGTGLGAVQSFTTAPAPTAPAVLTLSATSVGQGSAQLQGEVVNDGGNTVTARGFYLSTDGNPDAGDLTFSAGAGTGLFSSAAGNLMAGTTYQFRAFATNAQGTTEGNLQTFTTLPIPSPDPIAPINGTTVGCCYFYLDWACVDGATAYEVQMSTTPGFTGNPVGMPEAPGGMLSVGTTMTATYSANCFSGSDSTPQLGTGSGGASGQTFYWRVRAILGGSPGSWSPTASFLYIF